MLYRPKALIGRYLLDEGLGGDLSKLGEHGGNRLHPGGKDESLCLNSGGQLTPCPSRATARTRSFRPDSAFCTGRVSGEEGGLLNGVLLWDRLHGRAPQSREGSGGVKMPAKLWPPLQAGVWQSRGTGTQGHESSLLTQNPIPRTRGCPGLNPDFITSCVILSK